LKSFSKARTRREKRRVKRRTFSSGRLPRIFRVSSWDERLKKMMTWHVLIG